MTTSTREALTAAQATLLDRLHQQERHYAAAIEVITSLHAPGAASQQRDVARLQQQLGRIRDCGRATQQATDAWVAEGKPRNAALQVALKTQEERMVQFLEKVESLQSEFQSMKDRLQPQLDQEVTRRSMHQAYQRSMRTGQGN